MPVNEDNDSDTEADVQETPCADNDDEDGGVDDRKDPEELDAESPTRRRSLRVRRSLDLLPAVQADVVGPVGTRAQTRKRRTDTGEERRDRRVRFNDMELGPTPKSAIAAPSALARHLRHHRCCSALHDVNIVHNVAEAERRQAKCCSASDPTFIRIKDIESINTCVCHVFPCMESENCDKPPH